MSDRINREKITGGLGNLARGRSLLDRAGRNEILCRTYSNSATGVFTIISLNRDSSRIHTAELYVEITGVIANDDCGVGACDTTHLQCPLFALCLRQYCY